jgi:hypothetical protein
MTRISPRTALIYVKLTLNDLVDNTCAGTLAFTILISLNCSSYRVAIARLDSIERNIQSTAREGTLVKTSVGQQPNSQHYEQIIYRVVIVRFNRKERNNQITDEPLSPRFKTAATTVIPDQYSF